MSVFVEEFKEKYGLFLFDYQNDLTKSSLIIIMNMNEKGFNLLCIIINTIPADAEQLIVILFLFHCKLIKKSNLYGIRELLLSLKHYNILLTFLNENTI